MARIVMLRSMILRWPDGDIERNSCPEIGAEVEVPESVLRALPRDAYVRASKAQGAAQDEPPAPARPAPKPHLASKVR